MYLTDRLVSRFGSPLRWPAMTGHCVACGAPGAAVVLDGTLLCERCADRRIAAHTGWAELPDPPAPQVFLGPDGHAHTMAIRLQRVPTGVLAEAIEVGAEAGEGHRVQVLGDHEVDVAMLVDQLQVQIRDQIATTYLEPHPHRPGWLLRGGEVRARLVWAGQDEPYAVVIDGRTLSWEEFGRTLEPFEGWHMHLQIEDIDDVRPDAMR